MKRKEHDLLNCHRHHQVKSNNIPPRILVPVFQFYGHINDIIIINAPVLYSYKKLIPQLKKEYI